MVQITIIGSSGFVGSHLVSTALENGYKVHATMREASLLSNKSNFLKKLNKTGDEERLKFFSGDLNVKGSFTEAIKDSEAVFVCAMPEKPSEPALIETVVGGINHILESCTEAGVKTIVVTSSTGSTNPKEGLPSSVPKKETEHWSDSDYQISCGKYSPAAKTLMDKALLKYGEKHPELRVVIFNPSLIAGPDNLRDTTDLPSPLLCRFIKKEFIKEIPNDSMSMIDVRDLAALQFAALKNPGASGRYFGVEKSYHWNDICQCVHRLFPEYEVPPKKYGNDSENIPTQFDHTRKNSLMEYENSGIKKLREMDEIFQGVIEDLKERKLI